ncbi:MAG: hypothetical protein JRJ15_02685 [Deltaproteobacteria bacterium]|nr:hypothetical protein [Deltaproteobacteria bacterium]
MSETWYEVVKPDITLTQGDLIFNCPLLAWQGFGLKLEGENETEVLENATSAVSADVVVMTQACDLEHNKVENVILCPHVSLYEHREMWESNLRTANQKPTEKAWKRHCDDIRDGFMWNLTMLNDGQIDNSSIGIRIVFFNEVHTIPRSFLESLLGQRQSSRLRLLPPYREHLSQAFARFFMRVGLPVPIEKNWEIEEPNQALS